VAGGGADLTISTKATSLSDRLLFGVTNAWFYLTRPLFVMRCHRHLGYWPNLAMPMRFAELMQWRKLVDRNPRFVTFADKLATKDWIAARLPELAIAETSWVGERPEDIPDALLAAGYIAKTNNASGQNYLPHHKPMPRPEMNRLFHRWLRASAARRWFAWLDSSQEWAYRPVPPRIFVERQVGAGQTFVDIAVRVMGGVPILTSCALGSKTSERTLGYFWPDGTPLEGADINTLPSDFTLPAGFAKAVKYAAQLGQGADYLRIDFLAAGDELYAGEITCYPASGFGTDDWYMQIMYRRWLETLPLSWALSTRHAWPRRLYIGAFRRWLDRRRREVAAMPLPKG